MKLVHTKKRSSNCKYFKRTRISGDKRYDQKDFCKWNEEARKWQKVTK